MSILKNVTQSSLFAGIVEKKPEIFMGISFALGVAACVITHKQTIKAEEALREEEEKLPEGESLDSSKAFRIQAPYYVVPAGLMAVSGGCLYLAAKEGQRKLMAATAAYMVSEDKVKELEDKTKDILGISQEKEEAREEIRKNPPNESNTNVPKDEDGTVRPVVPYGNGDIWFYDTLTKQYFLNTISGVEHAINELNAQLMDELSINLNDYLFAIKARSLDDDIAKNKIWDVDDGLLSCDLDPIIEDGKLYVTITHYVKPKNR